MVLTNNIINFFNDIKSISFLFDKKDLPVDFAFKNEFNDSIEILIDQIANTEKNHYGDRITFTLKFFKNRDSVDISELDELSLSLLLKQYEEFVDRYNTSNHNIQLKTKLRKNFFRLLKLNTRLVKNDIILKFFVVSRYVIDVYTVDDFNKKPVNRTILNSMDRINIINSEFIGKPILLKFHKNNMLLIDYLIQNNFSLLSKSISFSPKIIIGFARFWILFGGFLVNIQKLQYDGETYNDLIKIIVLHNEIIGKTALGLATNIILPILIPFILWFAIPRIIGYYILKRKYKT